MIKHLVILFAVLSASQTQAAAYRFAVTSEGPITETCTFNNQRERSQIKLYIPDGKRPGLERVAVKVRVCTGGRYVRSTFTMLLPLSTWSQPQSVGAGWQSYGHPRGLTAQEFFDEAPDRALWRTLRVSSDRQIFELLLTDSRSNLIRLGPVAVTMAQSSAGLRVPGFDELRHYAIERMDIVIQGVMLRSRLMNVQAE